jgi:HD-GYP domain-containing protein (c-di-GMP phosphodiesterase class II)
MDEDLLMAMESVVDDLYGHVLRVSDLAVKLGLELALEQDDLERLAQVAVLHDVGKVHVDPAVLAKPGPLDDLEVLHIRRHPHLGYAMTTRRVDSRVAEAILCHHERFDGTGYPFGLKAGSIPLFSRIVLVADAFDAITTHRAYKPALPVWYAVNEILANSRSQFDPDVVDAFITVGKRGDLQTAPIRERVAAGR